MAQNQLSLRLYDILEEVGASEEIRRLHNNQFTSHGIYQSVTLSLVLNRLGVAYICGSSFEGSVTPDLASDVDELDYSLQPVVLDAAAAPAGRSLLVVRHDWTFPGYVKLQHVWEGLPVTEDLVGTIPGCCFDTDGRHYVCGADIGFNDGAAISQTDENGLHIRDLVMAFQCKMLPEFVRHRLYILRRHKLISKSTAKKLAKMGCMFVAAGYYKSPEKHIEWRMSLVLQERYLMSKLNPTQHKVYILLKMLKRDMFQKKLGCQVFTSYHCKTCVLYTAEMYEKHLWTPENLIPGFLQCLKLLMRWLKRGFCPNFFITDQNLFSKEGFSRFRWPLLHMLERLIQLKGGILELIETDRVGHMLQGVERRRGNQTHLNKCRLIASVKDLVINSSAFAFSGILNKLCGGEYSGGRLERSLHLLQQINTIDGYTSYESQSALSRAYPWFHLHLAKSCACESFRCQDASQRKRLMTESDSHFKKAKRTDLANVRLAKASILYKAGQYEACFWLLQQVEHAFTYKVKRLCTCNQLYSRLYKDQQEANEMVIAMASMSVTKIKRSYLACCVEFLPSESDIAPAPLLYEMRRSHGTRPGSRDYINNFWFDWAVIDAKVFLYFMQYLVSAELEKEAHKQVAMGNILAAIVEDEEWLTRQPYEDCQLGHRETAYNLLGWIYMQERRYEDALRCFEKSWAIRPHHNAAKFHMRDLMTRL